MDSLLHHPSQSPPYRTSDLGTASFLMSHGCAIQQIEGIAGRSVFVFAPDAAALAESYDRGAVISARSFYAALKDLKRLVHRHAPNSQIHTSPEPRHDTARR
jgi:hypothetical protein